MHVGDGTTSIRDLNPGIYIIHSNLANGKSLNSKFFYGSINSGTSIVLENSIRRNIMKGSSGCRHSYHKQRRIFHAGIPYQGYLFGI